MARSIFEFPPPMTSADSFADAVGMDRKLFQSLAEEFRAEHNPQLGGAAGPAPGKIFTEEAWPMLNWIVDKIDAGTLNQGATMGPAFKKKPLG